MSDDTLKTFDNLSSISNQDIDDALDIIPISHGVGTISQGDKKVKIGQLQQMTVLRCRTDGNVANKQAEYVGGLPLNGNSQDCIGRTVLVIFDNKNTATAPTFSFNNLTGQIILLNQASNVTLGAGCVLANSRNIMTWDGQNWCLHSDIAELTSDYTKYADGTSIYNKNYDDHNKDFKLNQIIDFPKGNKYFTVSSGLFLFFSTDSNYGQFAYLICSSYNSETRIIPLFTGSGFTVTVSSFKTLLVNNTTGNITANIMQLSMKYS